MQDVINFVAANWADLLNAAGLIVGGAAILAKYSNNKSANKYIQIVLNAINWLGQNTGKAKNDRHNNHHLARAA